MTCVNRAEKGDDRVKHNQRNRWTYLIWACFTFALTSCAFEKNASVPQEEKISMEQDEIRVSLIDDGKLDQEEKVWLDFADLDFAMEVQKSVAEQKTDESGEHTVFLGECDGLRVELSLWDRVSMPDISALQELVCRTYEVDAEVVDCNGKEMVKVNWPHGEVNYYLLSPEGDAYCLWITPHVMKDPEVYWKVRAIEKSFCAQSEIQRVQAIMEADQQGQAAGEGGQQGQAAGEGGQQDQAAGEGGQQGQAAGEGGQQDSEARSEHSLAGNDLQEKVVYITIPERAQIDYLVLVNSKIPLPEGWEENLDLVYTVNSVGDVVPVERTAYKAYLELRAELEKEGIELDLDSAYRSVEYQQDIMDRFTEKYGEAYARRTVAIPGYSEHHTGLALDLYFRVNGVEVYENEDLVQYPEIWKRIHAHLAEFGFILRYPNWKNGEVDYTYEPWHIRYVGLEAAGELAAQPGLSLEDYLKNINN